MPPRAQQVTEEGLHEVWNALTDGRPVVITSHVRLDGDGLGSSLAVWHALRSAGVQCCVALQPPTPTTFDFLPGTEHIATNAAALPERYHLAVIDCGNVGRLGELGGVLNGGGYTINIDHHASNTLFGDLNYVNVKASSCGEMVHHLFGAVGVRIDRPIAECLFAAVVTDTGQFSHENVTSAAFATCADCVQAGVRPHELVQKLFFSPTQQQMRLRHMATGTLQFHASGRIATMAVTLDMFAQTGLGPIDTEGFADIPIEVRGVEASALLKEMPDCDYTKVSMRSRGRVDVCAVARSFGGGGHTHAAGCEVMEGLESARCKIVRALREQFGQSTDG